MDRKAEKILKLFRSSRPEVFCKGVLINFAKFAGKHLSQSLFFNKVIRLRPANLAKKRHWHMCFPVCDIFRTHFSIEHLWWLLLTFDMFSGVKPPPKED